MLDRCNLQLALWQTRSLLDHNIIDSQFAGSHFSTRLLRIVLIGNKFCGDFALEFFVQFLQHETLVRSEAIVHNCSSKQVFL